MIKRIIRWFRSTEQEQKDLMRLAKTEYAKDWEYAYYALQQGKRPYTSH